MAEKGIFRTNLVENMDMLPMPNQQKTIAEYQAAVGPGLVQFIEMRIIINKGKGSNTQCHHC